MARKPPKHEPPRAVAPKKRPSSTQRGYGACWRRLRKLVLERDPVCQWPGCHRLAECVDHHVSLGAGGTNSMSNLRAYCKPHHDAKTYRHDGALGRPRRPVE